MSAGHKRLWCDGTQGSSSPTSIQAGIIFLPFPWIRQDLVGLLDFLKLLLTFLSHTIRMALLGQSAIGIADVLQAVCGGNSQDPIVVFHAHVILNEPVFDS